MIAQPRHTIGGYREYAPPREMAFFAEAYWTHHSPKGTVAAGAGHRILPELAISIAFDVVRDDRGRPIDGGPFVIGPKLRPQVFAFEPNRELAAVRVKPEWVGPMLGIDPLDFESEVVDLHGARPVIAAALQAALARTRCAADALAVLADTVLRHRASRTSPADAAAAALDAVRRTAGAVRCERIADRVGVSLRHLRRQVHDGIGMSPKRYARTLRLVNAVRLADAVAAPPWADIAARTGYCDQSHLIRECVEQTGCSPGELHAERGRQVVALAERSNPA